AVDDDGVGEPSAGCLARNRLGFEGVEAAAEGDDLDAHRASHRTSEQCRIERALIFEGRRPGHQHVIVAFAPFDGKRAAGKRYLHRAVGALQPRRSDRGGAGRRAASLGQSGAALPGADGDVVAVDDMGERDVGALREDRMIFQERPEAAEIIGIDIIHPEDRMRVAHADRRGRMQQRRIDRPDLQLDIAGVAKFLGKRNILPAEFRRAHVDSVEIGRRPLPAVQQAGLGLEGGCTLPGRLEHAADHAAHAIAAGAGFGTIIVVDADERLGAVEARLLQHHQLVVRNMRCNRTRLLGRHGRLAVAQVDDNDLIADAVHLGKGVIGKRAHQNIQFLPALYGDRRGAGQPEWWRRLDDSSVRGRNADKHVRQQCFAGRAAGFGEYRMNFRMFRLALAGLAPAAVAFSAGEVLAQAPSPTASPEVAASPSPAPTASPAPAASPRPAASASPAPSASPSPSPPAAAQNPPPAASVQTADPFGQEIKLEAKKVVLTKGSANWDAAFDTLVESLKSLDTMLDKQGIKPSGNPMIVYTSTDDTGFTFLAEIPVDQEPKNLPKAMSMGQSPEGRALKFVHRCSYDNMDNTYGAITNHLDEKKLEAKVSFIDESLTDPIKTAEDKLVINVYVPLK